ncbi:MAG: hypothetical protein JWR69_487 [Pedosphaera sp.]|nr:hypothetical protein [Pedosphaera sp.]
MTRRLCLANRANQDAKVIDPFLSPLKTEHLKLNTSALQTWLLGHWVVRPLPFRVVRVVRGCYSPS